MCGIAGLIHKSDKPIDLSVLQKMTRMLTHRGPDDEGYAVIGPVGLGHRRLSIIDLAGGHQPMTTPDGRYTIAFNGEIYNFLEIRSGLEKEGIRFITHSDTEVLLHLYAQKKEACLKDLNGMFAFAIWDDREKKLFAARDRMGKKPFYYWDTPQLFSFASECKAFRPHPDFTPRLDIDAARHFFQYEYVPAPYCIYEGVKKLPAAHYLIWDRKGMHVQPYWDVPLGTTLPLAPSSVLRLKGRGNNISLPPCGGGWPKAGRGGADVEIEKNILFLLDRAVERRLMSDVPLGVFLSGGVDSSAVVALMARHRAGKDIQTFSIGFNETSFDESVYAEQVARRFGTDHHLQKLTPGGMLEIFPEVTDFLDEPFADYSIIPTYLLSRFTRGHVTVALGGDGGDELFAGYPTFYADRLASLFSKIPGFLRTAKFLADRLPVSHKDMSVDFKAKQFLRGASFPPIQRNQVWLGAMHQNEIDRLFCRGAINRAPTLDQIMQNCLSSNPGDRMLYFYQKFYLEGDILVKTDRASMAASLEVRAPFLDRDLVDYVSRLPFQLKLKGNKTKFILKKTLEKILPNEIINRKKKGFGIPIGLWLKEDLRPMMEAALDPVKIKREGLFNPDFVSQLVREHVSGKKNNRKPLFALLMFEAWREKNL